MTERDLQILKDLPVPQPRTGPKWRAIETAKHAFDANRDAGDNAGAALAEKNSFDGPQADVTPLRQTGTTGSKRVSVMTFISRPQMAIAASIAALIIAAPFAFDLSRRPASTEIAAIGTEPSPLVVADSTPVKAKPTVGSGAQADVKIAAQAATKVEEAAAPIGAHDAFKPFATSAVEPALPAPEAAGKQNYSVMSRLGVRKFETAPSGLIVGKQDRDTFSRADINPVKDVAAEPVSTFSIDVDTASYSFVRRAINAGELPPKDAVRVEELINYFPYAYPAPDKAEAPFKPSVTVMPSPWNPNNKLVHVAIQGYDLPDAERPRANLVFLIDVSGSMEGADRLSLVKNAFRLLLDELKADDSVGIVTYAGESGIALEPTKVRDKAKILDAIDRLGAGGSTAGAAGIQDAYRLAEANFDKASVNRIVLATDGDFNVGVTDREQLKSLIERKRETGVFLSILGVGQGNHNDALMQTLAQNGNGTAAYVDTLNEARKVLVDEASSTLFPIAKDVKIQIEWNPARIAEYRLIGYESRVLKREDFNNDRVDAGDIGSGHSVTAIYEVTPVGQPRIVDQLRYGKAQSASADAAAPAPRKTVGETDETKAKANELGFLSMRYKRPNDKTSQLLSVAISDALDADTVAAAPDDVRFSIAVAAFGQLLRGAPYTLGYTYDDVLTLAQGARGADPFGYRSEFLNLVRLAKSARP